MYDLAIINGKVYFDNKYHKTNIYIKDGIIANISPLLLKSTDTYNCNGDLVLPGIIDPHTHFHLQLGKMYSRDDFLYGTKAAAFGGVTTIIDFLEPVDNAIDLEHAFKKRVNQAKRSVIDYKFHACLKNPIGEVENITLKMKELGLNTVKVFTTYSDSNRRTYDKELKELLVLSNKQDFLVTAHIENDEMISLEKNYTYRNLPESRPTISEVSEAMKIASYVRETKGNLYMVHLSSGKTLKRLKDKYSDILNRYFTIESCPHYFVFNNKVINRSDGYLYTMAPPLRSEEEVQILRSMIDDVYTIGTDHCAFNKKDKNVSLLKNIPLGIGGVEESFSVMFSIFGTKIIDKMTLNVAKIHRLFPQKGIISEGSDADLFVYHLEKQNLKTNHGFADYNVYYNFPVDGNVVSTISRGKFIVKDGAFSNLKGQLLNKGGETDEGN